MDLRDYLRFLRSYWQVIVTAAFLGGLAAGAITAVTPPHFVSTTELYVSVELGPDASIGEIAQGEALARQAIESYIPVISTSSILQSVIHEHQLDMTVSELREHINAVSPFDSVLIRIAVAGESADWAATVANAIGESFTTFVNGQSGVASTDSSSGLQISAVQAAHAATATSTRNALVNITIGLLAGGLVGFAVGLIRNRFDSRVKTPRDLERLELAPLLVALPLAAAAEEDRHTMRRDQSSSSGAAFRYLSAILQPDLNKKMAHTLVMTSSGHTEGVTTTALNTAVALSESGMQVAIVDANFLAPQVAAQLGLSIEPGLTDVLAGRSSVSDVLQRWGQSNLYVLSIGTEANTSNEVEEPRKIEQVVRDLAQRFDYVVFDTPPLPVSPRTATLVKAVANVIMVVAIGHATTRETANSARIVGLLGGNLVGFVATMAPTTGIDAVDFFPYRYSPTITSHLSAE